MASLVHRRAITLTEPSQSKLTSWPLIPRPPSTKNRPPFGFGSKRAQADRASPKGCASAAPRRVQHDGDAGCPARIENVAVQTSPAKKALLIAKLAERRLLEKKTDRIRDGEAVSACRWARGSRSPRPIHLAGRYGLV